MMRKHLLFIFGTRPEAIKLAPLIRKFSQLRERFKTTVCVTGQHREMLDQVLSFFEIKPDVDLNLMTSGQSLNSLSAAVIKEIDRVLERYKPDQVWVQGDTTTSFAAAYSAFNREIIVCHVEAGLRTYNSKAPFPEEINRQLTSRLTEFHFAPTARAYQNLKNELIPENRVFVTGNTVIDALFQGLNILDIKHPNGFDSLNKLIEPDKKLILITGHRRENFGNGFEQICKALKTISERSDVQVIYPVHLNPEVQAPVKQYLGGIENIHLISPLPYHEFIWLMNKSDLILTDSGGIQEEAPSLGKHVFVMREVTERQEAVESGMVELVGTDPDKIVAAVNSCLDGNSMVNAATKTKNPFGDGKASDKIIEIIEKEFFNE